MKLITAIAALALVAGSVDVDAQKRGDASKTPGGGKAPGAWAKAPEGAEEARKPLHLARFAIAHFDGLTGEDRAQLIEAARNGDETAQEELEAAVTAGLERVSELLADEGSRKALELGITLGIHQQRGGDKFDPWWFSGQVTGDGLVVIVALEEQIEQWGESTAGHLGNN